MVKKGIAAILYAIYRIADPVVRFQDVSILTYHSISDASVDTAVSPSEFEKQLAHLTSQGHTFVSLASVVEWYTHGSVLPRKAVALTFDDGYADFEAILPILRKFGAPGAVFVMSDEVLSRPRLGNDIALLSSDALQRLRSDSMVEIGFHGKTHADMRHLKGEALRDELQRQEGMRFFAFAGGSYTHEAVRIVQEFGYTAAFSIKPGLVTKRSNAFLMPRNVILRGMSPQDVEFRTTKAIQWYTRAARWFK